MLETKKRSYSIKKILLSLSISGSLLFLSGCWDRVEINDIAIVTAAAIDKTKDNQVEISLQIFVPKALSSGGGQGGPGGQGGGAITMVGTGRGKNIAEALSKLQGETPRKVFWGQCRVFIFGEKIAKEGIQDHLDFLLRHPQPRERGLVFVSQGMARTILELQTQLELFSAETVREQAKQQVGMKTTLQDLAEMLNSEARAAALPYIEIETEEGNEDSYQYPHIFGTAIFRKDKMVGRISERRTRGILWIRDEIKDYTVTVTPEHDKGDLSFNPVKANIKMIPEIHGDEWKMNIKIETEGAVIQNRTALDLANPSSLKIVEKAFREDIENRIRMSIQQVQQKLNADIVGFAREFHRKYPKQWRQVEHRWNEVFPEVKVNIDIAAYVNRQGNINKSMKLREKQK